MIRSSFEVTEFYTLLDSYMHRLTVHCRARVIYTTYYVISYTASKKGMSVRDKKS